MGCVCTSWFLQHSDDNSVDSIDSIVSSFSWSLFAIERHHDRLRYRGSEGNRLLHNEHHSLQTEWIVPAQKESLVRLQQRVMLNQSMNSLMK